MPWTSTHTGRWHTGKYLLVQEERARPGGEVFDTLSIMGVDPGTGAHFARCFENHGFCRNYEVTREDETWRLTGEHERAAITFGENNRKQTVVWEWRPAGKEGTSREDS